MSEQPAFVLIDTDQAFFKDHPGKQARIRDAIGDEQEAAFLTLQDHDVKRRRIIVWRLPRSMRRAGGPELLKIPFVPRGDETIENEDRILIPLIHELMQDAAKQYGIKAPEPQLVMGPPPGRRR